MEASVKYKKGDVLVHHSYGPVVYTGTEEQIIGGVAAKLYVLKAYFTDNYLRVSEKAIKENTRELAQKKELTEAFKVLQEEPKKMHLLTFKHRKGQHTKLVSSIVGTAEVLRDSNVVSDNGKGVSRYRQDLKEVALRRMIAEISIVHDIGWIQALTLLNQKSHSNFADPGYLGPMNHRLEYDRTWPPNIM